MGKNRSNIFSRQRRSEESEAKEADKRRRSSVAAVAPASAADHGDKKKSRDLRSAAKQKSDNNRSLRRMKKRGVVRQMFEKIPKEVRKSKKRETAEAESEYDIPSELYPGPETPTQVQENGDQVPDEEEGDEGGEDIYESRKLLIRQMQGLIAKEVQGSCSEYDSWSDLEENFALAYEPIPLHINMDTWRKMSKKDILKTVRSKKMKLEFETLSRSEILGKIEMMQKSAHYLSVKFGVHHLLPNLPASDGDLAPKPDRPRCRFYDLPILMKSFGAIF
jgi:hypothetical protein